ncbi:MAG TPA: flagellar hook protein FlgE [Rugosimonospora sp.]|nr:flagellar hook protein FlgE [Rugosimonospora sp.]
MLRSLFAGISGLRAHQQMMDVTANNIANINTTGFKSSTTTFEDTLSQLVTAAGAPTANLGGTNPAQVGLGVRLGAISTNFAQGAAQTTGRNTDLMIQGDGFFVVRDGSQQLYTRNGAFSFDTNGFLTTTGGAFVQGWKATNGVVTTTTAPTDVQLPIGTVLPPSATTTATVSGNLPTNASTTTPYTTSITGYDSLGNPFTLTTSFTYSSTTGWSATVSDGTNTSAAASVTFTNGAAPSPSTLTLNGITVDISGVTNYSGASTIATVNQNGYGLGSLQSFSISQDGMLVGVFSNGLKQTLAQVCLATFNNPMGLEKVGDSMYQTTANSGTPQLGQAGSGGRGVLQGGALEMSNVDLAQEFTNLVIAQRGFEANSKVITTSDELLQDLVNLKR